MKNIEVECTWLGIHFFISYSSFVIFNFKNWINALG